MRIRLNIWSHPSWVCGLKLEKQESIEIEDGSHPSWVCGLKRLSSNGGGNLLDVTPFVGVWIETCHFNRWLGCLIVTPFVGVWIETFPAYLISCRWLVTPFVGVWIETLYRIWS